MLRHTSHQHILNNGIRLLLIDIPEITQFRMLVSFDAGYRRASVDPDMNQEAPHVLEHMLFEGSKKYPSADTLDEIFSTCGWVNGTTSPVHVYFPFDNRLRNAEAVMDAAFDMLYRPLLTRQAFDEELTVAKNEIRQKATDHELEVGDAIDMQTTPDFYVRAKDQLKRLESVTYDNVRAYHKKYYTTANTSIVIATDMGSLTQDRIIDIITQATADVPRGALQHKLRFAVAAPTHTIEYLPAPAHLDRSIATVVYVKPQEITSQQGLPFRIFVALADNARSYSVTHKLRKMGIAYDLDVGAFSTPEMYGMYLTVREDDMRLVKTVRTALDLLLHFIEDSVTDEVFRAEIEYWKDSLDDILTPEDIMDWYAHSFVTGEPFETIAERRESLEILTKELVFQSVRELMVCEYQYAAVMSDKQEIASDLQPIMRHEPYVL